MFTLPVSVAVSSVYFRMSAMINICMSSLIETVASLPTICSAQQEFWLLCALSNIK